MSFLRRISSLVRYLPIAILLAPVILVLFFQTNLGAWVDPEYSLNDVLLNDLIVSPVPSGIFPSPGTCANGLGINCKTIKDDCIDTGVCNRTGSASCIGGSCSVTATNAQCTADGCDPTKFGNWYRATDGTAWEVRYYRKSEPACAGASPPKYCFAYQIRAASVTEAQGDPDPGNPDGPSLWCGDGACNNGETCSTRPQDCGLRPTCGEVGTAAYSREDYFFWGNLQKQTYS
jgi:hypothetical protein